MRIVFMRRRNAHRVRKSAADKRREADREKEAERRITGMAWLGAAATILLCGGLIIALQPRSPMVEAVAVWLTEQAGQGFASATAASESMNTSAAEEQGLTSATAASKPTDAPASPEQEVPLARKVVALTFDDGPHSEITPKVLDVLKEEGVPATFFLMGENAVECPKLVKRMVKEGHEVGNHTYTHVDLSNLSQSQAEEEINRTQEAIYDIIRERPILLRPPFGKVREKEVPEELLVVEWNVDTLDWTGSSPAQIISRVQNQLKPGAIILMHDQYPGTVEALPELIRWVREQGYEFVTVEELLLI